MEIQLIAIDPSFGMSANLVKALSINNDNFSQKLEEIINNEDYRNEIIKKQYAWAIKYTSFDFISKYILL